MNYCDQYATNPASVVQFCRFWSDQVDALDRHLSARTWALGTVAAVLIAYPVARIVIPTVLDTVLPHVVRTVLNLM
jgi:hypothetical protein